MIRPNVALPSAPEAIPTRLPLPRRRPAPKARFLTLVRRVHLYSGLLLLPWVLLYGVTAFLFNHPEAFSDRESRALPAGEIAALSELPEPEVWAREIVAKMREDNPGVDLELVEDRDIEVRGSLRLTLQTEGQRSDLRYEPGADDAELFHSGTGEKREAPAFARSRGFRSQEDVFDRIEQQTASFVGFAENDIERSQLRAPTLRFWMSEGDRLWRVSHDPVRGSVQAEPADAIGEDFSTRRFLLRLHTAHGFPAEATTARFAWAVLVDLMAGAMVVWGLSGVLMWWQLKRLRWAGFFCLVSSLVGAGLLGVAMFGMMQ
ncbi:MAG: PepSY domain-containing protein [Planctomycetota bacterium]